MKERLKLFKNQVLADLEPRDSKRQVTAEGSKTDG